MCGHVGLNDVDVVHEAADVYVLTYFLDVVDSVSVPIIVRMVVVVGVLVRVTVVVSGGTVSIVVIVLLLLWSLRWPLVLVQLSW